MPDLIPLPDGSRALVETPEEKQSREAAAPPAIRFDTQQPSQITPQSLGVPEGAIPIGTQQQVTESGLVLDLEGNQLPVGPVRPPGARVAAADAGQTDPEPFTPSRATRVVRAIPGSAENPVIAPPQIATGMQTATSVQTVTPQVSPAARKAALAALEQREAQAQEVAQRGRQRADRFFQQAQELSERGASLLGSEILAEQDQAELQAELEGVRAQRDTLRSAIQGERIDAGRFWAERSTGQKVATALGLIFGALGRGGRNRAAEILQQAIDRDVNIQLKNLASKRTSLNDFQQQVKSLTGDVKEQRALLRGIAQERAATELDRIAAEGGASEAATNARIEAEALRAGALEQFRAFEMSTAAKKVVQKKRTPFAKKVGGKQVARELSVPSAWLREHAGGRSMQFRNVKAANDAVAQKTTSDQFGRLLGEYERALRDWMQQSTATTLAPTSTVNQKLESLRTFISTQAAKAADPTSVVRAEEAQQFGQASLGNDPRRALSTARSSLALVAATQARRRRDLTAFMQARLVPTTPQQVLPAQGQAFARAQEIQ